MKLIVCVDDRGGLTFGGKRVSRDGVLIRRILDRVGEGRLWVTPYSAPLFEAAPVCVDAALPARAGEWCFLEDADPAELLARAGEVWLYRWNRHYPSDRKFPGLGPEWTMVETAEFEGKSHPVITEEVYRR